MGDSPNNIISNPGVPDARTINVVATYSLTKMDSERRPCRVRINLARLAKVTRNVPVKYSPSNFAAVILYIESKPHNLKKTTVLMFSTGNIVHTGATTEQHARLSAHYFIHFLNKSLEIPAILSDFVVVNIVATIENMGFKVDVEELGKSLGSRATYDPRGKNGFPACRIRSAVDRRKQVSLVCFSGSVVITGCRTREDIRTNQKNIYEECVPFAMRGSGNYMSKSQYMLKKRKEGQTKMKTNVNRLNKRLKIMGSEADDAYENTRSFAIGRDGDGKLLEWPSGDLGSRGLVMDPFSSSIEMDREDQDIEDLTDLLLNPSALENLLTDGSDARGSGLDYRDLEKILLPGSGSEGGIELRGRISGPSLGGSDDAPEIPVDPKVVMADRLYASEFHPCA